jgi:hypothetical protein
MTTSHLSGTDLIRYTVQPRYNIYWRRSCGIYFPRLRRTLTSCTLTQRALLSPNISFSNGALTTEVSLAVVLKISQEGVGTSVTSTNNMQQYITRYCTCTRYLF